MQMWPKASSYNMKVLLWPHSHQTWLIIRVVVNSTALKSDCLGSDVVKSFCASLSVSGVFKNNTTVASKNCCQELDLFLAHRQHSIHVYHYHYYLWWLRKMSAELEITVSRIPSLRSVGSFDHKRNVRASWKRRVSSSPGWDRGHCCACALLGLCCLTLLCTCPAHCPFSSCFSDSWAKCQRHI